jgi:hypothetical protein
VLFRLAYLGVTNTIALLRLLPMSDRDKDHELLDRTLICSRVHLLCALRE